MVFVHMRQQHFVDLLGAIAGRAKIVDEPPAAIAVQAPGSGIDEDQLLAGVHEEGIDGALHRLLEECAMQIAVDGRVRHALDHLVRSGTHAFRRKAP
jgi:hypothetical protein